MSIELHYYVADIAGLRTTIASIGALNVLAMVVCPPSLRHERIQHG